MAKPYVYADITVLRQSAQNIKIFLDDYNKRFNQMNEAMTGMSRYWVANDYTEFMRKWNDFYRRGSLGTNLTKQLKSYEQYLEYAALQYEKCQKNAIDRAARLK